MHVTFISTLFHMKLFYLLQNLFPFLFFPQSFSFIVCLLWVFSVISKSCNVFCFYVITRVEPTSVKVSTLTFFSDITYKTFLCRGFVWNEKKKRFYLIWCWFIFFYLIDKGFCPIREFVFCNKLDRILAQKELNMQTFLNQIPNI